MKINIADKFPPKAKEVKRNTFHSFLKSLMEFFSIE